MTNNEYEVMKGADVLVLITEWNQLRRLDLQRVENLLAEPVFFDLRNLYKRAEVARPVWYEGKAEAVEAMRQAAASKEDRSFQIKI